MMFSGLEIDVETAFGRAMIASVAGQPQIFGFAVGTDRPQASPCSVFLQLRVDEERLLDSISLPDNGKVLDYGCGVGRHLSHIRAKNAAVQCFGIDTCDLLLNHCRHVLAPATFVKALNELEGEQFDLIMLMGNGLGVLGDEIQAVSGLEQLVSILRPHGRLLIESGNPFGAGYATKICHIQYQQHRDGPFNWGFADRAWVKDTMRQIGSTVEFRKSDGLGGMFFFAVAEKS